MYVDRAADDEMFIYCIRVNKYLLFHFFSYLYHYPLYKCSIKGKAFELFPH